MAVCDCLLGVELEREGVRCARQVVAGVVSLNFEVEPLRGGGEILWLASPLSGLIGDGDENRSLLVDEVVAAALRSGVQPQPKRLTIHRDRQVAANVVGSNRHRARGLGIGTQARELLDERIQDDATGRLDKFPLVRVDFDLVYALSMIDRSSPRMIES